MAPKRRTGGSDNEEEEDRREDRLLEDILATQQSMQASIHLMATTLASLQPKEAGDSGGDRRSDPDPHTPLSGLVEDKAFDRFCKRKPKEFSGLEETSAVEDRLLDVE